MAMVTPWEKHHFVAQLLAYVVIVRLCTLGAFVGVDADPISQNSDTSTGQTDFRSYVRREISAMRGFHFVDADAGSYNGCQNSGQPLFWMLLTGHLRSFEQHVTNLHSFLAHSSPCWFAVIYTRQKLDVPHDPSKPWTGNNDALVAKLSREGVNVSTVLHSLKNNIEFGSTNVAWTIVKRDDHRDTNDLYQGVVRLCKAVAQEHRIQIRPYDVVAMSRPDLAFSHAVDFSRLMTVGLSVPFVLMPHHERKTIAGNDPSEMLVFAPWSFWEAMCIHTLPRGETTSVELQNQSVTLESGTCGCLKHSQGCSFFGGLFIYAASAFGLQPFFYNTDIKIHLHRMNGDISLGVMRPVGHALATANSVVVGTADITRGATCIVGRVDACVVKEDAPAPISGPASRCWGNTSWVKVSPQHDGAFSGFWRCDQDMDVDVLCEHNNLSTTRHKLPSARRKLPTVGTKHTLSSWFFVFLIIILISVIGFAKTNTSQVARRISGNSGAVASYLCTSISIDLLIASSCIDGESNFAYEPACMVVTVEIFKLVVSMAMLTLFRRSPADVDAASIASISDSNARYPDVICRMLVPALLFTLNNLLVFLAIGKSQLSDFGVFRDTNIIWTAVVWYMAFNISLGRKRLAALGCLFIGLCLSQIERLRRATYSSAVFVVCLMAFTNSLGSVCNELVLKRFKAMDLNLQNAILYTWCAFLGLLYLATFNPAKLESVDAFLTGFHSEAVVIICLQSFAGLSVSRMLKKANSVFKSIAVSLRGPILVFIAPVVGVPSRTDPLAFVSAVVVGLSACWYMLQGPLERPAQSVSLIGRRAESSLPGLELPNRNAATVI